MARLRSGINAFDAPMVADFRAAGTRRSGPTHHPRRRVSPGDGASFCTGVDVKELDRRSDRASSGSATGIHMIVELERLDVPVIAAIQGHCLGGG